MYVISKQLLRMYRNKLALRLGWNSMARFNGEFESRLPQQRDMLRIKDLSLFILLCWKSAWQILISRTVVWTLKFLSPTNAPLSYTCKILKYTARLSHYCSYMFRSTWTIIREPMPNLAKVTILWKQSLKIGRFMFSNVGAKSVSSCSVYCVPWGLWRHGTQYTPQLETLCHNIAEHITTYFYLLFPQNRNFSKVRHRLPDDGPDGSKHVGAIMR